MPFQAFFPVGRKNVKQNVSFSPDVRQLAQPSQQNNHALDVAAGAELHVRHFAALSEHSLLSKARIAARSACWPTKEN